MQSAEFGRDQEVVNLIKEMFGFDPGTQMPTTTTNLKKNRMGGQLIFIPHPDATSLQATIKRMGIAPDLIFDSLPGFKDNPGEVSYIHKIKDRRDIFYIANSSDSILNTFVELRGKVTPELWFPQSGKIVSVENISSVKRDDQVYTRFQLKLPAVHSVFIVGE